MRKIVVLLIALTLALAVPMAVGAQEYPTSDDYKISIDFDGRIGYSMFDSQWNTLTNVSGLLNEPFYHDNIDSNWIHVYVTYDFTDDLQPYFPLISSATNVWVRLDLSYYLNASSASTCYSTYKCVVNSDEEYIDNLMYGDVWLPYDGSTSTSPFDLAQKYKDSSTFSSFRVVDEIYVKFNSADDNVIHYVPREFSLIVYLQGISGTDANMFLVVDGGFKNIENAIKELKQEVAVVQGQLGNINDSINQGFDGILAPDQGDVDRNDQIAGDLADNKQEVDDIIGAMDSVEKPDVDDAFELVNPEQIVDLENESVQEMTGILASVTGSSVVKNYLLLLFGIALVSFIFFGKKGG